jgi:ABC-type lipoprotein release transport system permease subunit
MIMKEYSRIFGVIGGFAYLVVGAMLFSVIYRNMKEHQATRTILNNLGMTEKKIKKFERREIAIYGIIGVVTGGALAVAICIIFGRSALIGKPEFQTLKDVCPNVVTVLVPILIFLLLYAIISEIVLLLTYKKEKEDGYEKN